MHGEPVELRFHPAMKLFMFRALVCADVTIALQKCLAYFQGQGGIALNGGELGLQCIALDQRNHAMRVLVSAVVQDCAFGGNFIARA
ncbi:hypothetical protein D3C80_2096650 [compost metagenome]